MKKPLRIAAAAILLGAAISTKAQCPPGETQVTMSVSTDAYGSETTWQITGPGGSPSYATGGPYTNHSSAGAYPEPPVSFCVPDGAVIVITVNDGYGDGMCCSYGNGGWAVSINGSNVATGGSFGSSQTATVVLGTDLGINTLNVGDVVAQGAVIITGKVRNAGLTPVPGFTLEYVVDGGTPVSQDFTTTVQPGSEYTYTFSTPWNATVGSHTLVLNLTGVNGDVYAANNTMTKAVGVASQSVQRKVLVEEFTSSTCGPCASYNSSFDPMLTNIGANTAGSNIAVVKYQMDWPAPGTDPSYNPDGSTRRGYYGVSGIPDAFLNGRAESNGFINNTGNLNAEAAKPAYVTLELQGSYSGNLLTVNATVTPHAMFTGTYKLFVAAVESYTYTGGTTSQTQFKHAMRKMLPNGSGTTLAAMQDGVAQNFNFSYAFTEGGVAQGNYNLWGQLANVKVVAFVQNTATKEVLQAAVVPQLAVGIDEANALDRRLTLYPNPTDGLMSLSFDLAAATSVRFQVQDLAGREVLSAARSFGSGEQRHTLDLGGLPNGSYLVKVMADGMTAARKVTLSR